jgi:hypothetical protein
MHKKGLALIELLGAVVIFGIMLSLSAMIISTITKANARIVEQSKANTEMTLLTAYLDRSYQNFGATNYMPCTEGVSDCIILINQFEYVVNLETQTISLVVHNPALEWKIFIEDQKLYIDNQRIAIGVFTLDNEASISYQIIGDQLVLKLDLIFVGTHKNYAYQYQQALTLETMPS